MIDALLAGGERDLRVVRLGGLRNGLILARSALSAAVPFLSQVRQIHRRRWNKFWLMVQVTALARIVAMNRTPGQSVLLLDQGPVYMLGILHRSLSRRPGVNGALFEHFWRSAIDSWAQALDLVIHLDADDDELYHRIGVRNKRHPVQDLTPDQAADRFRKWRVCRHLILEQLQVDRQSTRCLYADTTVQSVDEIRRRFVARIDELANAGGRSSRGDDAASVMDGSLPL